LLARQLKDVQNRPVIGSSHDVASDEDFVAIAQVDLREPATSGVQISKSCRAAITNVSYELDGFSQLAARTWEIDQNQSLS